MYEIEKGIPVPEIPPRLPKYPWEHMEVGDSFFVSGGKQQNITSTGWKAGKTLGRKFVVRAEGDGVRVWRVA